MAARPFSSDYGDAPSVYPLAFLSAGVFFITREAQPLSG